MSRNYIIDLDRTLFATGKFTPLLHLWIEETYGLKSGVLEAEQEKYYSYIEDLYAYDLFSHLRAKNIDTDEFSHTLQKTSFANDAYLFEGATELLELCKNNGPVTILSFGHDDYQRLKYQLCPTIVSAAPLVTTLVPKYKMLSTVATGDITLIDDKAIGHQLPSSTTFIQALPEATTMPLNQPWPVFLSLHEIEGYIKSNLL